MKKILLAGAAVLTLGVGAYSVYAEAEDSIVLDRYENTNEFRPGAHRRGYDERDAWFDGMQHDRHEYREERIQSDLDSGRITEQEANRWREQIAEKERYYEENGRYRYDHHNRGNRNRYGHYNSSRRFNRNNRQTGGYCH